MRASIIPMNLNLLWSFISFLIIFVVCFGSVRMIIPSSKRIAAKIIVIVSQAMFFCECGGIKICRCYLGKPGGSNIELLFPFIILFPSYIRNKDIIIPMNFPKSLPCSATIISTMMKNVMPTNLIIFPFVFLFICLGV